MNQILPDEKLKQRILTQGCYAPEENQRIYDKWFAAGPRYQFQAVNRDFHLTDQVVCDIGCSYGMNLLYCQPGSYGIEVDKYQVDFARSIGIPIHERDFIHDSVDDLPKVDVVWCSAVLEHVESIHTFLRKLSIILKPGGLLVIYVPTIPLIPALGRVPALGKYLTAHLYSDHINAFTPSTLRFFCERAGYETRTLSPYFPFPLSFLNKVPLLNRLIDGVTLVGRKIPDWDYPQGATRTSTDDGQGFVYHDWFSDSANK